MPDIVRKLRSDARDENGYSHPLTPLLIAAADEIERLRALLTEYEIVMGPNTKIEPPELKD